MDAVIEIDDVARLARVQAGVLGPRLEEQLNAKGWTFGASRTASPTRRSARWYATRSSGMQSDKYGDIADITTAFRRGHARGRPRPHRTVPSKSTGPDVNQMLLGSEGRLGIITVATVRVHRTPEVRGYLFPDWYGAISAMAEIAESAASPSVTRVADPARDAILLHDEEAGRPRRQVLLGGAQGVPRASQALRHGSRMLGFIGYEGTEKHVKLQRKLVGEIV